MQHIPFSYSQRYCSYTGACQLTGMVNSIMGWEASSGIMLVTDWMASVMVSTQRASKRACTQYGYHIWLTCDMQYCYCSYIATM